jgi:hypothetical protein
MANTPETQFRLLLFEFTTALLAFLVVGSAVVVEVLNLIRGTGAGELPQWHGIAVGATIGYYLAHNQQKIQTNGHQPPPVAHHRRRTHRVSRAKPRQ